MAIFESQDTIRRSDRLIESLQILDQLSAANPFGCWPGVSAAWTSVRAASGLVEDQRDAAGQKILRRSP